jgi:hypothetical protein
VIAQLAAAAGPVGCWLLAPFGRVRRSPFGLRTTRTRTRPLPGPLVGLGEGGTGWLVAARFCALNLNQPSSPDPSFTPLGFLLGCRKLPPSHEISYQLSAGLSPLATAVAALAPVTPVTPISHANTKSAAFRRPAYQRCLPIPNASEPKISKSPALLCPTAKYLSKSAPSLQKFRHEDQPSVAMRSCDYEKDGGPLRDQPGSRLECLCFPLSLSLVAQLNVYSCGDSSIIG